MQQKSVLMLLLRAIEGSNMHLQASVGVSFVSSFRRLFYLLHLESIVILCFKCTLQQCSKID